MAPSYVKPYKAEPASGFCGPVCVAAANGRAPPPGRPPDDALALPESPWEDG